MAITVSNAKPPSLLTTDDFRFEHFLPEICPPENETNILTQVQVRIGIRLVVGTSKYLNIREGITICLNYLFCFDKICNKPFSVGSPSPHASACKWNGISIPALTQSYITAVVSDHYVAISLTALLPSKFNKRCWEQVTYKYFSNHKSGTWDEDWNKLEFVCKSLYRSNISRSVFCSPTRFIQRLEIMVSFTIFFFTVAWTVWKRKVVKDNQCRMKSQWAYINLDYSHVENKSFIIITLNKTEQTMTLFQRMSERILPCITGKINGSNCTDHKLWTTNISVQLSERQEDIISKWNKMEES